MKPKYEFECSIKINDGLDYSQMIIAETYSKARYKFYLNMDSDEGYKYWFKYIKVRKIRKVDSSYIPKLSHEELVQFQRVVEYRGIPFAHVGMKISVNGKFGKIGKIVGSNSSSNLNVLYDDNYSGHADNCHPTWKTIYYDKDNNVVKDFTTI